MLVLPAYNMTAVLRTPVMTTHLTCSIACMALMKPYTVNRNSYR